MDRDKSQVLNPPPASTEAILESISDGVFTVDGAWRITSFNRAAEQITGVGREEVLGRRCAEVFRSSLCEAHCALRETLETGRPIINRACFIIDAEGERIPVSISTAVLRDGHGRIIGGAETFRDLSEVEALREQLEERVRVGELVSRSPAMLKLFEVLPAVAASPSTVLIEGETGTGKELLARALHQLSPRAEGPFVARNCGALPETLLESELFGYKAGAFTGAERDKPGRFAAARGGTLMLDEVGEVSPALQVRLLRVLQERVYEPLGSNRSEPADVRVIAATHRKLAQEVKAGRFREDLYYRIHVVRLELPPLRERLEDLPLLVDEFIEQFNRRQGKAVTGISPELMAGLLARRWPGNIRELENLIERAFVLATDGPLEPRHLPGEIATLPGAEASPRDSMDAARRLIERRVIESALARHGNNRQATADELGIHKSTLFRKMRRLGIEPPATDGRHRC